MSSPKKTLHRKSLRLKGYDYSNVGFYFLTLCTKNRGCLFGRIQNYKMTLNQTGEIATLCWLEIPLHFPNAILHNHIVMPNHVHGIIEIKEQNSVRANDYSPQHNFRSPHRTIGSIIRGYKIGVMKALYDCNPYKYKRGESIWQRNYHEHIIRNEESFRNISQYIANNPIKWQEDIFYKS